MKKEELVEALISIKKKNFITVAKLESMSIEESQVSKSVSSSSMVNPKKRRHDQRDDAAQIDLV